MFFQRICIYSSGVKEFITGCKTKINMENHNHNSRSGELKNLKIAVAIPTKNRLDDLIRAIESVKKQTCQPHELIIVDQSVTGIARAHIDDLLRDYPDIKLKYILNQGLTGLTAAKNLAIRSSASDILLFIDDDIILDENFLWEITRVYERYPELDGVGGVVTAPSHKTSALRRRIAVFFQVGPFFGVRPFFC